MSAPAPSPRDRQVRVASFVLVTLVGLWLLWPIPLGHPPLSKDHTVHLTRIWAWADVLAHGAPRGWSEVWFFGTPIGEVYPILGDALVVLLRVCSIGLLDWHQAYALGFTVVFVSQGWALLRLGRMCGLGPLPGLVAALLCLCDAGAYREGGWIYTVDYGVWPQTLANTLTWLGLGEAMLAADCDDARPRAAAIGRAALAFGGALLAHPITLVVLALCVPLAIASGLRTRARLVPTVVAFAIALLLGLGLAAWWVWPMGGMRMWMVSYGWLWQPLSWMVDQAQRGHLIQGMPMAVSSLVALGVVAVAIFGNPAARVFAACGVLLWLWTAEDTLWDLRLDLVSPAFGQMQWQRFLIACKPGLLLAAGAAIGLAWRAVLGGLRRGGSARIAGIALGLVGVGMLAWCVRDSAEVMSKLAVGAPQVAYDPEDPSLTDDYAALAQWLDAKRREEGDVRWRVMVAAPRNLHWFMDMPVRTGVPMYKAGFTPGDNFVHKPEADTPALLDRLDVRYVVTRRGSVRDAVVVERFGALKLWERKRWAPQGSARLLGTGALEVLQDDPGRGIVQLRVSGSAPDTRLVFDIAGYPRWQLEHDGREVTWVETPAVGDGPDATIAERRSGALRGGKAEGDDGTEPTLIAAPARDGLWTLRYRVWGGKDVLALAISLLAAAVTILLRVRSRRFDLADRIDLALEIAGGGGNPRQGPPRRPWLRPWMVATAAALAVAAWAMKVRSGHQRERTQAIGWVDDGIAEVTGAHAGPLKTDMLVHPAVLLQPSRVRPRPDGSAPTRPATQVRFPAVTLTERLTGWFALDDDAAKMRPEGRHTLVIEISDGQGGWITIFDRKVPHGPGRQWLDLPTDAAAGTTADLRVRIESDGLAPPELGFDLDLGAPKGP